MVTLPWKRAAGLQSCQVFFPWRDCLIGETHRSEFSPASLPAGTRALLGRDRGVSSDSPFSHSPRESFLALLSTLDEAECLNPVGMEGNPVSVQPPMNVEVGGIDTEFLSNRFFLVKTTGSRDKFHSTWEYMTNFLKKFSEEHRMPTLRSRISVSCFDILDSMSGRVGATISFGSLVSLN